MIESVESVTAAGVAGSPSASSRSRALLDAALTALERRGVAPSRVDLARLPADALLGRRADPAVAAALATAGAARIPGWSTPCYLVSDSRALRGVFGRLRPEGRAGTGAIPITTVR